MALVIDRSIQHLVHCACACPELTVKNYMYETQSIFIGCTSGILLERLLWGKIFSLCTCPLWSNILSNQDTTASCCCSFASKRGILE
jgi:hypothetical protein